jgi:hypothetical protein
MTYYDFLIDILIVARQAVKNIAPKEYNLFGLGDSFNCQEWMDDFRQEYKKILKQNTIDNLDNNPLIKEVKNLN